MARRDVLRREPLLVLRETAISGDPVALLPRRAEQPPRSWAPPESTSPPWTATARRTSSRGRQALAPAEAGGVGRDRRDHHPGAVMRPRVGPRAGQQVPAPVGYPAPDASRSTRDRSSSDGRCAAPSRWRAIPERSGRPGWNQCSPTRATRESPSTWTRCHRHRRQSGCAASSPAWNPHDGLGWTGGAWRTSRSTRPPRTPPTSGSRWHAARAGCSGSGLYVTIRAETQDELEASAARLRSL
jgi:hypothetical protein